MGRRPPPPDDDQLDLPIADFLLADRERPPSIRDKGLPRVDPLELIDRLAAANLDTSALDSDEVNDLPRPANVLEWINDPRFCAQDPPAFAKTFEFLLSAYEEYCPHCTDPKLLTIELVDDHETSNRFRRPDLRLPTEMSVGEIQDRVMLLRFGVCPHCKRDRRDIKREGLFHDSNEGVLIAGQRSTKSTTVGGFAWSYTLQDFVRMEQPARRYGIPRGQYLETFFTAITEKQAAKTLWKQAMMVFDNSPWFKQCIAILNDRGKRIGRPLFQRETTFLAFHSKNIACAYGAPKGDSQRGRTRIFTACSEWGWFAKTTRKVVNEDDIYTAMANSLLTVRGGCEDLRRGDWFNAPDAMMFGEGSPWAEEDMGMRLLRDSAVTPRMVGRHYSTFEFNPKLKPHMITRPRPGTVDFIRDFLAIPPRAANPFIEDSKRVEDCIDPGRFSSLLYSIERVVERFQAEQNRTYIWAALNKVPQDQFVPRVMAIDAGEVHNSFAIVLGRVDQEGRTVVEGAIEVIPEDDEFVSFPFMLDRVILPLCEKLFVRFLRWDRWQSSEGIQRARLRGVSADRQTLRPPDFREFKQRQLAGRIRYPSPEVSLEKLTGRNPRIGPPTPIARLIRQVQTVRQIGQKVEKPLNGTDDLFRALVLVDAVAQLHAKQLAAKLDEKGLPIQHQIVASAAGSPLVAPFHRPPTRLVATPGPGSKAAGKGRGPMGLF